MPHKNPQKKSPKISKFFWFLAGIFVALVFGNLVSVGHQVLLAADQIPPAERRRDSVLDHVRQNFQKMELFEQRFGRLDTVKKILDTEYFRTGDIDHDALMKRAVQGYVAGLDDPFTTYLERSDNEKFQESLKGEENLQGIGAVVSKREDYVLLEEILKESPAFRAGLQPLDRVYAVDGEFVAELSIDEAVQLIRGPKGTTVTLTVVRDTDRSDAENFERFDVDIIRDEITVPSVEHEILRTGGETLGLLTISMIGEETEYLLRQNITDLKKAKIDGLILDLRGNGGGLLPIAVQIASHFLPRDTVVVAAEYQDGFFEEFRSRGYDDLSDRPVVILIDQFTASASEIITLALDAHLETTIVGTQSFGKWSIQTITEFPDGDALKFTIGRRLGPDGQRVDRTGITPDIIVELDREAYLQNRADAQLDTAISTLLEKISTENSQ